MGKKPISGKAKKQQLQDRKARKHAAAGSALLAANGSGKGKDKHVGNAATEATQGESGGGEGGDGNGDAAAAAAEVARSSNTETSAAGTKHRYKQHGRERFELRLDIETKDTIAKKVELAQHPLPHARPENVTEWGVDDSHNDATVTFFAKPPWTTTMTKEELEAQEEAAFLKYKTTLSEALGHTEELSYFENNLETWRQLWHVLDISDVIFMVLDARYPSVHFSPGLYTHVVTVLKLPLVLILNKCDLVEPAGENAHRATFPNAQCSRALSLSLSPRQPEG